MSTPTRHHRPAGGPPFVRDRRGHARVTNEELFFDLIYAFAVTQLSHRLLEGLDIVNALQTLVLWFAVWLGWQYTCWVTNWFNPENPRMRLLLFVLMAIGLVMGATIPAAFAEAGLAFALCYATIQVGRTLVVLANLGTAPELKPNFRRILGWVVIAAVLWIAGGLLHDTARLACWIAAVLCEYVAPMIGFALPGLGRSRTAEWTIAGGHLAERNQLFVMIALGESILATGASFSASPHLDLPVVAAFVVAFIGSVAMWWVYFDTSSRDGSETIEQSDDPGRIGALFHYVHVTLIAGVIVAAVADELVLHHPGEETDLASACVLVAGPLIYLVGNAVYKRIVYGGFPLSHLVGSVLLMMTFPVALQTNRLVAGALTTAVMIVVAVWQTLRPRRLPHRHQAAA